MKPNYHSHRLLALAAFLVAAAPLVHAAASQPDSITSTASTTPADAAKLPAWPHQFQRDGATYTIYQPQIDSWSGDKLVARAAVSVLPPEAAASASTSDSVKPAPTYGVIKITADTETDRSARTVTFEKLTVTDVSFPSAADHAAAWTAQFRSLIPQELRGISLDRLEASLAVINAAHKGEDNPLRNDPPDIRFFTTPALLLTIEGEPQWRAVADTNHLERLINTRALILRDSSAQPARLLLHFWDGYLEALSLDGPWKVSSTKLPAGVETAEKSAIAAHSVDLLAGQPDPKTKEKPSLKKNNIPAIVLATKPTELIVLQGEPKWTPIPGTDLLFIENTPAHVFKETKDQSTYVLVSGRWFVSTSGKNSGLDGPWKYVSGKKLPSDFASIPDDSPQENVKASIPGTRQAQEAVIANTIPQTAQIERSAKLSPPPVYDGGAPKLAKIDGTPLHYVVNTATPIIQVDDKTWFACYNAVWFSATSASGPWSVATSVPAIIYTIPPSSPLHYITYVRVYRYDTAYVWVGYTPGYYGAIIGPDGTVVYGTGYIYPPYVSETIYVSYPCSYGYYSNLCWTPWAGWAFGFAVGWAWGDDWDYWGPCPPAPWWGPYYPYCYGWGYNAYGGITAWGPYGWAGTSGNIYHDNGPWHSVSRAAGGYDGLTGNEWATQYGHAYNSTTGTKVVGQRGAIENVYTGSYAEGGRAIAHNDTTGVTAFGQHGTIHDGDTGKTITGGSGTVIGPDGKVIHTATARGEDGAIANINGNVYAGHDGHVYQRNDDGSWTQLTKPQPGQSGGGERRQPATPVAPSTPAPALNPGEQHRLGEGGAGERQPAFDHGALDRDFQSRNLGAQRERSFQMARPAFQGFGGGGFHGGGGFRGGGFRR
ncbi:autotransporter [Opitutaceae bacterium TAV4]|nr:autotransporter [Opitutaceae bacterium TAV4]RRK00686.1 autotransporter [Opitutaceae bacterium TAV3]